MGHAAQFTLISKIAPRNREMGVIKSGHTVETGSEVWEIWPRNLWKIRKPTHNKDEGGHCDDDAVDGDDEEDEEGGDVEVSGKGVKLMLKPTSDFGPLRLWWTSLSSSPKSSKFIKVHKKISEDYYINDVVIDLGWLV